MYKITYNEREYNIRDEETILAALMRQGQEIRFSCKKGICKTCKTKLVDGKIPANSQKGLKPHLIENGIILPCVSIPESDMMLAPPAKEDLTRKNSIEDSPYEFREEEKHEHPNPDLELWKKLDEGTLLLEILTDFYTNAYQDTRLAPFFKSTSIDRAIGKQYNFLQQIITGEKVYFGFYPRSAHHWMVIDDELFDYREELLEQSMIKCGLEEKYRKRWRFGIDEPYRKMILKTRPWPKIIGDLTVPLSGFEVVEADFDMICDKCFSEILQGTKIRYHQEEGSIYCNSCAGLELKDLQSDHTEPVINYQHSESVFTKS